MEHFGDKPYIARGAQIDPKRVFFFGDPTRSLSMDIDIAPGYGYLPPGTVLAEITSEATRKKIWIPYAKENPAADVVNFFGAFLLANGSAADTDLEVTLEDSYKFRVGDHVAVADNDTNGASAVDCGAISAIDRTTYPNKAILTIPETVTTAITTAANGAVYIQTSAAAPFTKAAGFLFGGVDTGTGENSIGAQGVVLLSHAMLYKGTLTNYDSEAMADLGASENGQYVILK